MKSLLAANGATVNTLLLPGKTICLPAGPLRPAPSAPSLRRPPSRRTTQPKTPTSTHLPQPPRRPAHSHRRRPTPTRGPRPRRSSAMCGPTTSKTRLIRIATRGEQPDSHGPQLLLLRPVPDLLHRSQHVAGQHGHHQRRPAVRPTVNATAALALYRNSGWAPWATTTPTSTASA